MQEITKEIRDLYSGQVRVRAVGICIVQDRILLLNHSLYGKNNQFFSPPGGGVVFGEKAEDALVREFHEETNLHVEVKDFLFINEHIQDSLHAIELFFEVEVVAGELEKGKDPELSEPGQIIESAALMSMDEIRALKTSEKHRIFSMITSLDGISKLPRYIPAGIQ